MKIELSTKPKLIYNKNEQVIKFIYYFPIKTDYKNIHYVRLLDFILSTTSNEYQDSSLFEKIKKQKLLISNNIYLIEKEKTSFIAYSFTIPKENIINDYDIEETFTFALSLIKKPFIKNNEFNKNKFYYEKDYFVERNKMIMNNIINKMNEQFYNIVDKNEYLGCNYIRSTKILKNITPRKLYKFYKKNIKDNKPFIYVYGNINKLNKLIKYKEENIIINIEKYKKIPDSKSINITKNIPLEQSYIYLEYKIINFKEDDIDYFKIITDLLNDQSTDLLFKKLRIEKNIIYSFNFIKYLKSGIFIIKSGIDEKNKNEFINSVNNILEELKINLEFYLKKLIEGMKINLLYEEDNDNYILMNVIANDLNEDTLKKYIEKCTNIDINRIYEVLNKIELKNIVFFRSTK